MTAWGQNRKKTALPRHFCYAVQTGHNQLETGHRRSNVGSRGQSGRTGGMARTAADSHNRTLGRVHSGVLLLARQRDLGVQLVAISEVSSIPITVFQEIKAAPFRVSPPRPLRANGIALDCPVAGI